MPRNAPRARKNPRRCPPPRGAGPSGAGLAGLDRRARGNPGRGRRPLRVLRAGAGGCPGPAKGFTLLELIVVILLLSILLGFAIPAFQAGQVGGSPDRIARELAHVVKKLKIAALRHQAVHELHLNLNENRVWVTHPETSDDPDMMSPRQPWERTLPDDIRIEQVRFADNRTVRSGTAVVAFYPQGHSDRAVIRLSDDGNRPIDLVVEAFLPMALIAAEDGGPVFP